MRCQFELHRPRKLCFLPRNLTCLAMKLSDDNLRLVRMRSRVSVYFSIRSKLVTGEANVTHTRVRSFCEHSHENDNL